VGSTTIAAQLDAEEWSDLVARDCPFCGYARVGF
jgi:hypothetical protein